jgi:hypothetical protein
MQSYHLVNTILYFILAIILVCVLGYYMFYLKSDENKNNGIFILSTIALFFVGLALTTAFSKKVDIF